MNPKKVIIFSAFVQLRTSLPLDELGSLVSERLFGGVHFIDTDEFDEGDGVRLVKTVLGMSATLSGYGGTYVLRMLTSLPAVRPPGDVQVEHHSLDEYVRQCLSGLPGVETFCA